MGIGRLPGFNPHRLQELRSARQLTAVDLADLVGVTDQTIASWETGRASPDPRRARRLAEILRVQVRDLTTLREDEMSLGDYRACAGKIMQDVAATLRISRNTLRAIEAGRREPSPHITDGLADELGLAPDKVRTIWRRTRQERMRQLEERLQA